MTKDLAVDGLENKNSLDKISERRLLTPLKHYVGVILQGVYKDRQWVIDPYFRERLRFNLGSDCVHWRPAERTES